MHPFFLEQSNQQVIDTVEQAVIKNRKSEVKKTLVENAALDAARTFGGALELFTSLTIGVPMETDEDIYEAGKKLAARRAEV